VELDPMTRSFRVDILPHHVAGVRKKLQANQRHKAPPLPVQTQPQWEMPT
jgi:hypothetical protein